MVARLTNMGLLFLVQREHEVLEGRLVGESCVVADLVVQGASSCRRRTHRIRRCGRRRDAGTAEQVHAGAPNRRLTPVGGIDAST